MEQLPTLKCSTHPSLVVCSVQVSQKCPIETRLACVKCMLKNKTNENFIEINDVLIKQYKFLNTEFVSLGLQEIMDCNQIPMGILKSQQQHLKLIDDFVKDMISQIYEFRQKLINKLNLQPDNVKPIEELRVQYDTALKNMQEKLKQVSGLDSKSKERIELEKCVESYVSLFYKADHQATNEKLLALKSRAGIIVEQQIFDDFKKSLENINDILSNQFQNCYMLTDTPFVNKLLAKITEKYTKSMKLLFSGQRDGMNAAAFWKHCENKGPTITICESKSGQIFGGYTPLKWINTSQYQYDASMTSFLFSVTKQQIYPLKQKPYAKYGNISYGPTFGGGFDLNIAADFQSGYSNLSHSYDTSQYQIVDPSTHLMGGKTPALKSIEIYLIE